MHPIGSAQRVGRSQFSDVLRVQPDFPKAEQQHNLQPHKQGSRRCQQDCDLK
jgi:hypothetical protein